jgi:hypothetical protein
MALLQLVIKVVNYIKIYQNMGEQQLPLNVVYKEYDINTLMLKISVEAQRELL